MSKDDLCPICLDTFIDPVKQSCNHYFCKKCIKQLINHNNTSNPIPCPLCRTNMTSTERRFILLPNEEDKKIEKLASTIVYFILLTGIFIIIIYKFVIKYCLHQLYLFLSFYISN